MLLMKSVMMLLVMLKAIKLGAIDKDTRDVQVAQEKYLD